MDMYTQVIPFLIVSFYAVAMYAAVVGFKLFNEEPMGVCVLLCIAIPVMFGATGFIVMAKWACVLGLAVVVVSKVTRGDQQESEQHYTTTK